MAIWDIIPTCPDPMSCYTLCVFVVLGGILTIAARAGMRRFDECEEDVRKTDMVINAMRIDMAVMAESLKNIETDGTETRTAIAEINRTLLDRLT